MFVSGVIWFSRSGILLSHSLAVNSLQVSHPPVPAIVPPPQWISGPTPRRHFDVPPHSTTTSATSDPFHLDASNSFFPQDINRSGTHTPDSTIDIASWTGRQSSVSSGGPSETSRQASTGEEDDPVRGEEDIEDEFGPPVFNRTYSCPLPARVAKQFARPPSRLRQDSTSVFQTPPLTDASGASMPMSEIVTPSANYVALQTLSTELSDSLQSAIQTLLHLSPPHLLDNAKEQYSGCTVQMPTTSLSALLTAMKGLNYLSANVASLCEDLPAGLPEPISKSMPASRQSSMHLGDTNNRMTGLPSVPPPPPPPKTIAGTNVASELTSSVISHRAVPQPHMSGILDNVHKAPEDFDIGELLQSTADLLGGQSAQAGVEIVLFHGDVGIKHTSVSGDGEGLGYALSHVSLLSPRSQPQRIAQNSFTPYRSSVKSWPFANQVILSNWVSRSLPSRHLLPRVSICLCRRMRWMRPYGRVRFP